MNLKVEITSQTALGSRLHGVSTRSARGQLGQERASSYSGQWQDIVRGKSLFETSARSSLHAVSCQRHADTVVSSKFVQ